MSSGHGTSAVQSVQLNINSPNFLIVQGRITKVLNMKPMEILAMIEEATGTRMFEDRRDKAFKAMGKKEMKLQENTELLRDEIEPKLEKLRMEKRAFLDFQQTQTDLERLTRLVAAHDYVRCKEKVQQTAAELESQKQRQSDLEASSARLKREIAHLEEDGQRIRAQREKEMKKGAKAQALEEAVKKHADELVRLATVLDLKRSSMAEEEERRKAGEKTVAELEAALQEKTTAYDQMRATYDAVKDDLGKQSEDAEAKEELLQTLQTGVASKDGQDNNGGYEGQLQDARNRATAAVTEQEQAKIKTRHLEKRIAEEEPRAKKAKVQNAGLLKDLEGLKAQAQKLEAQLSKLGFRPGAEEAMYEEQNKLQQTIRELKQQSDALKRRVANIDFHYADPTPQFDRSKVKGLVAQLFTLDDEKNGGTQAGTALEICAGGRLYNVVVDTEVTGTQLLKGAKLRKRVTIIPLNKIAAFKARAETVATAQKLAPGKVHLALSLVGYDEDVAAAMEYVFGNTLICADAETAKRVTFDPSVRMRSITLEGDAYDPSGTLSGGSAASSSGVLVTLQKLNAINNQLREAETALQQLQEQMAREKSKLDQAHHIQRELDLKTHEVKLAEEQIRGNASSSILHEVEHMKEQIVQLRKDAEDAQKRQVTAQADIRRIEQDMHDFDANKDGKLRELQTSLDQLRATLTKKTASVKALQKQLQGAQLDAEQASGDLATAREQQQETEQALQSQQDEIAALATQQAQVQGDHDTAQASLDDERAKLHIYDDELRAVDEATRRKTSQIAEEGLERQTLGHAVERIEKEQQQMQAALQKIEQDHDGWMADEKDKFGRPGSTIDRGSSSRLMRRECQLAEII